MIFPIKSEVDVLMMDETDYQEHMLLTCLESEKSKQEDNPHDNSTNAPNLMEEDSVEASEFLDSDKVGEISATHESKKDKGDTNNKSAGKKSEKNAENKEEENNSDLAKVGIPSKFDILCGQSRICANHTGNRRFQVVLDIYAPKYDGSNSKQEKMTLTKEIVACISASGGRFLKYKDGLWQEISTVTARDKVSHALRTKVSSWKRQQKEEQSGSSDSVTSTKKGKPTHRRKRSSIKSRRSSSSSVATNASDIFTNSFDGSSSESSNIMDELLKAQREIFANLTSSSDHSSTSTAEKHPLKK